MREAPQRVAVSAPGEQVSYQELNARADQVARRLRDRGVGPETLVALHCQPGVSLIAAMLGILKAGAAYLPIDPAYPAEWKRLLLADSGVKLVVGEGSAPAWLEGAGVGLLDPDSGPAGEDRGGAWHTQAAAHHLAYVIYTSGSTGIPKGVEVEHRNIVRLFASTEPWFGFGHRDVWSMFHSVSFDFSVWEIWGALLHGGRLVIVPPTAARAPAQLLRLLRAEQVTVLSQTPSAFRQLIWADAEEAGDAGLALRMIVLGGERLDVPVLCPWIERHGDERIRLVNMYGITETTVHVTYRRIVAADLLQPDVSPIGVAIPDLKVTLCNESGTPVPDGTPGEFWVSGPGVARGYHNRPDLTAERFRPGHDGARAYRSGDRGVRDERGELVFLGRIDDQIKVRGFRIEPQEVETCLRAHPDVTDAVVAGRDYGDGDVRLVAYLQPAPGVPGGETGTRRLLEQVRRRAAGRLPAHLRPADYHVIAEIPRTPQGKADRAVLRRNGFRAPPEAVGRMAVGGRTVALDISGDVRRTVEEVLQRDAIAPDADLFDLGVTSLAFIRIITQINERFGLSLTGTEVGDTASIGNLASAVEAAHHGDRLARMGQVPDRRIAERLGVGQEAGS